MRWTVSLSGIGYFRKAEGFATKLPPRRFAKQRQLRQDLQRHIAIQLFIMCAKNHPHSASADVLNNAVTAKNLANCGSGDRHERMVGWATTKVNIDTTDACEMLEYASAERESGREKYASVDLRNLKVYLDGDVATVSGE